jgi:hypothetical protein
MFGEPTLSSSFLAIPILGYKKKLYLCSLKLFIMEQIIINVEDKSILNSLRKILNSLNGVSIVKQKKKRKTGLDEAIEDVKAGRVYTAENSEEMFKHILG